jgi:two-component system OmpR family sensor kinase
MLRSLYGKLALALLGVLLAAAVLIFIAGIISVRRFLDEVHQEINRPLAAQLVKDSLPMTDGEINFEALEQIFHTLMVINPSIEVYLLGPEGRILSFSAPKDVVVREQVSMDPIHSFLGDDLPLPILGDDPRNPDGHKVFSVAPVGDKGDPDGYLYIVLAGQQWDSAIAVLQGSYILRAGAAASAAGLLVALLVGLMAFALITRRLSRLEHAMTRFRDDGFQGHQPVSVAGRSAPDEIDRLAHTFDEMAERLAAQLNELEKTDRLRRELVTNISHDLRTPLTSLHGYLETLDLKKDTISDQDRERYVEAAIRQSDRLNRLVTDLFELARLDSGTRELEIEPLALTELVQDAIQQFRLDAESNGVELSGHLPNGPASIRGDVGLLAQALDNLLANALRHTPKGGKVTVKLQENRDEVILTVQDTGTGIDSEELPHVFERFFHGSRSAADSDGVGLGLAITKRVVDLHGGKIWVESPPAQGATFSVSLPRNPTRM